MTARPSLSSAVWSKLRTGSRRLIATEPSRAAALCEAFLAGCDAKAEQLDDSSGNFGMFAKDLICLWIKGRQAGGADPDETAATLLRWMDDDPYAFCYQIEKETSGRVQQSRTGGVREEDSSAPRGCFGRSIRAGRTGARPRSCARSTARKRTSGHMSRLPRRPVLSLKTAWRLPSCSPLGSRMRRWRGSSAGSALDREKQFQSTAAYDLDRAPPRIADQARSWGRSAGGCMGRFSGASLQVLLRRPDEVRAQGQAPGVAREGYGGGQGRRSAFLDRVIRRDQGDGAARGTGARRRRQKLSRR